MNILKKYQIFLLIFLAYIVVFIYYPVIKNPSFFCLDDQIMVVENQYITSLSWDNVLNIFSKAYYKLYHPLVTISFAIEYYFFKLDPYIYHITNILLHILNTFFVFFIFVKLTKSYFKSFVISLFFAVYPTNVEVVAWISARKDLLYSFFFLASILFYLKSFDNRKNIFYFLSLLFFLAACFSKTMAVTLPAIIILIDFFCEKKFLENLKKYLPFFIISVLFSIIAVSVYYTGTDKITIPLFEKILKVLNVHYNLLFYIYKVFFPFHLSAMYPKFYSGCMPPWYILYSPCLVYLLFLFSLLSLKFNKKIFFAIMFFTIAILPIIGFFKNLSTSDVACRYCYIAYLGFFYVFSEILYFIYKKFDGLKILSVILFVSLFGSLGFFSYKRAFLWADNLKFLNNEITLFPDTNYLAYLIRGSFYLDKNIEQAEKDTIKSYKIFGPEDNINFQIALIQQRKKEFGLAKYNYSLIQTFNAIYMQAVMNKADIMFNEGSKKEAINMLENLKNTYKFFPIKSNVYFVLGKMYKYCNNNDKALENLQQSLKLNKFDKNIYINIAEIYERNKDTDNLEKILLEGLKNTEDKDICNLLSSFYCETGNFDKAYDILIKSLQIYPDNYVAYYFLGNVYGLKQEYKKALSCFTMAILLTNNNGAYFYARAATFMNIGNYEAAKKDMEKSLKKGFNIGSLKYDIEKIKNK